MQDINFGNRIYTHTVKLLSVNVHLRDNKDISYYLFIFHVCELCLIVIFLKTRYNKNRKKKGS